MAAVDGMTSPHPAPARDPEDRFSEFHNNIHEMVQFREFPFYFGVTVSGFMSALSFYSTLLYFREGIQYSTCSSYLCNQYRLAAQNHITLPTRED
jgi:hypothetical protein